MSVDIVKGNLLEGSEEGVILTVDGSARGLEGNIARAFARKYPEVWEEVEYRIENPIPLGTAKVYEIDPELECENKYCFIASTLHHIEVLDNVQKLRISGSAMWAVLSLASVKRISSVSSGILSGGWRLEIEEALDEMVKTYRAARSAFSYIPLLRVYVLGVAEFQRVKEHMEQSYPDATQTLTGYTLD